MLHACRDQGCIRKFKTRGILFDRTLLLLVWFPERERKNVRAMNVEVCLCELRSHLVHFCVLGSLLGRRSIPSGSHIGGTSRLDDGFQEVIL